MSSFLFFLTIQLLYLHVEFVLKWCYGFFNCFLSFLNAFLCLHLLLNCFGKWSLIPCFHHLVIERFSLVNMHRMIQACFSDFSLFLLISFLGIPNFILKVSKFSFHFIFLFRIGWKATDYRFVENTWSLWWEKHPISSSSLPSRPETSCGSSWIGLLIIRWSLNKAILHWFRMSH